MATVSQLPASLNLVCTVGNDFTLTLAVTENGSTWSSTGATLATDIIARDGTVVATDFTTAATDGQVTLTLTDTQTTTLGVDVYHYRLSVTKSGNTRDWIAGTLSVVEAGIGGTTSSAASLSITTGAVALSTTTLVAPAAANISVADADGFYVGDTVEEVLAEIPTKMDTRYATFPSLTSTAVTVPYGAQTTLTIPTYDGSGTVVHPSLVFCDKGWNGYRYWLAFTPLPSGNSAFENPSVVVSNDGATWTVPAGGSNPIEPALGGSDYNSDPHLLLASNGYMYLFWRAAYTSTPSTGERVYYRRSTDGITWSARTLIHTENSTTRALLSPCLVEEPDGTWRMYVVDNVASPNVVNTYTAATVDGPWSGPTTCTGFTVDSGRDEWHLDLHRIGGEYVAVFNDTLSGGSSQGTLYRATSTNGTAFTTDTLAFPPMMSSGGEALGGYRIAFIPARVDGVDGYEVIWANTTAFSRGFVQLRTDYRWQDDPSRMAAACGNITPYVAGDCMNRADSATVPGTATSGLSYTVSAGTVGVSSKALYAVSAANTRATLNAGISDGEFGLTIKTPATGSEEAFLVFRYSTSSNYWRFGKTTSQFALQLVNGSVSTPATAIGFQNAMAAGDRLKVVTSGSSIKCYYNDRLVIDHADSTFSTATSFGFQTAATAPRFTNLYAKT